MLTLPSGRSDLQAGDRLVRAVAFVLPAAILSYYALRGASYDSVVWQEEAIVVWWVLGLGYAFGILPRASLPRAALVPLGLLAALVGLALAALLWTDSAERTLAEVARFAHYGGVLVLVLSLVDRGTWRQAAAGLVFAAVLIPGLAVASRLLPELFPIDEVNRAIPTGRLNYPLDYWNALAAWSAMGAALALAWSADARHALARAALLAGVPICGLAIYLTFSRGGILSAAVAVLAVLVLSPNRWTAAVHTGAAGLGTALAILVARGYPAITAGGEGAGAGAVALALLGATALSAGAAAATTKLGTDRVRLPRLAGRAAAGASAVLITVVLTLVAGDTASSAWDDFTDREEPPGAGFAASEERLATVDGVRYEYWTVALETYAAQPLRGVGPGTYELSWNMSGGASFVRDAHSLYLEQLAELGVPGLALIVLLLGSLLVLALRARVRWCGRSDRASPRRGSAARFQTAGGGRASTSAGAGAVAGLIAGFVVFLFHASFDWLWESTAVTVLGLTAVAIAIATPAAPPTKRRKLVRAGVALLAIAACLLQLPNLISTSSVRESQAAYRAGDLEAAFAAAGEAVDAQPWAATPYSQRALLAEAAGELDPARADALLAIEREPTNWRHRLLLARIEAKRDEPDAAVDAYQEAERLWPASPFLGPRD